MSIKVDSVLVHRGLILGCLKALLFSQRKSNQIVKEESFASGYQEGYQDAIMAVAQLIHVENELLDNLNALGPLPLLIGKQDDLE